MDTKLEEFAVRHRLRTPLRELSWLDNHPEQARRLPSSPQYVPGRYGQLYDWEDGQHFAAMVHGEHVSALRWGNARRAGLAVGMTCEQNGDAEGTLRFDPTDPAQVKVALRVVRPRRVTRGRQLAARRRFGPVRSAASA